MSGPKSDRIYVSHSVLAAIERQRQFRLAEEQRRKELERLHEEAINERNKIMGEIQNFINRMDETIKEVCGDIKIENSDDIKSRFINSLNESLKMPLPQDTADINKQTTVFREKLTLIREQFLKELKQVLANIKALENSKKQLEVQESLAQSYATSKKEVRLRTVNIDFAITEEEEIIEDLTPLELIIGEYEDKIGALTSSLSIEQYGNLRLTQIVTDMKKILKNESMTIKEKEKALENQVKLYEFKKQTIDADLKDFNNIYDEYVLLCEETKTEIKVKDGFNDKTSLTNEVTRLRDIITKQQTEVYIQTQIDQVMKEYNYNVIRSDYLKKAERGTKELYQVDDDSAISVYLSNQGLVMMEVVAIGDDSPLSEADISKMVDKQEQFCTLHPKITKALEARGVIMEKRTHQAPNRDFVRKVQTRDRVYSTERKQAVVEPKVRKVEG